MQVVWWPLVNQIIPLGFLHCILLLASGYLRPHCKLLSNASPHSSSKTGRKSASNLNYNPARPIAFKLFLHWSRPHPWLPSQCKSFHSCNWRVQGAVRLCWSGNSAREFIPERRARYLLATDVQQAMRASLRHCSLLGTPLGCLCAAPSTAGL